MVSLNKLLLVAVLIICCKSGLSAPVNPKKCNHLLEKLLEIIHEIKRTGVCCNCETTTAPIVGDTGPTEVTTEITTSVTSNEGDVGSTVIVIDRNATPPDGGHTDTSVTEETTLCVSTEEGTTAVSTEGDIIPVSVEEGSTPVPDEGNTTPIPSTGSAYPVTWFTEEVTISPVTESNPPIIDTVTPEITTECTSSVTEISIDTTTTEKTIVLSLTNRPPPNTECVPVLFCGKEMDDLYVPVYKFGAKPKQARVHVDVD